MTDTTNIVNTHNGHKYVDLGLPSGTLWATCNVGATSPEQAGLYFAFGETKGFTAEQVKSGERAFDDESYTAYSVSDNLTLEQDVAHVHMGGKWRMPTKKDWWELLDNCNAVWTDDYNGTGVAGRIFTSKTNGKSVFFPAAGYCYYSFVSCVGSYGFYWSASWYSSSYAWYLSFYFAKVFPEVDLNFRCYGCPVRGVCERE